MRKNSGLTLGTTLLVLLLLIVLGFTVSSLSVSHLQLTGQASRHDQAQELVDSALALALEKVLASDGQFGQGDTAGAKVEYRPEGAADDTVAHVCFDRDEAGRLGVGYSLNNLASDVSAPGFNDQVVPRRAVHLVAEGRYRGTPARAECVVAMPPFPYGIASAGPIHGGQGLLVAGVPLEEQVAAGVDRLDPEQLTPSHIISTSSGPGSVHLDAGTRVAGDLEVRELGVLDFDPLQPAIEIQGQVLTTASADKIPHLTLSDYDPAGMPDLQVLVGNDYNSESVAGFLRWEASANGDQLRFRNGLELDGALLFVDGDLHIAGGVRGTGALVVTGDLTIEGGAALDTDNRMAALSGGKLTLHGDGQNASYFLGMVYSEGGLEASDLTVLGTLVQAGEGQSLRLDRTNVILREDLAEIEIPLEVDSTTVTTTTTTTTGPTLASLDPALRAKSAVATTPASPATIASPATTPAVDSSKWDQVLAILGGSLGDIFDTTTTTTTTVTTTTGFPWVTASINDQRPRASFAPSRVLAPQQRTRLLLWRPL
ncbi:MAG: hypothetical protein AB7S38_18260 [Vulcanimicrobiota bacterium]